LSDRVRIPKPAIHVRPEQRLDVGDGKVLVGSSGHLERCFNTFEDVANGVFTAGSAFVISATALLIADPAAAKRGRDKAAITL
jgi:hypothetical protein